MFRTLFLLSLLLTPSLCLGQGEMPRDREQVVRDFLSLVPRIVEVVPPQMRASRPLLIDLRSFVLAGSSLTGVDLPAELVRNAMPPGFVDVAAEEAVVQVSEHRVEVLDQGVHIRLDGMSRLGSGWAAFVTFLYTDSRGESSAIGATSVYLSILRRGDSWVSAHERILATS